MLAYRNAYRRQLPPPGHQVGNDIMVTGHHIGRPLAHMLEGRHWFTVTAAEVTVNTAMKKINTPHAWLPRCHTSLALSCHRYAPAGERGWLVGITGYTPARL